MITISQILLMLSIATHSIFDRNLIPPSSLVLSSGTADQLIAMDPSLYLSQRNRVPRPRTSRSGLCVIAPGLLEENFVIWSDRPFFLWSLPTDGSAIKMQQVRLLDNNPNPNYRRILWETSLPETANSISYNNDALQPGQKYNWELVFQRRNVSDGTWETVTSTFAFQVMDNAQRQPITTELQALTQRLQATGASAETIANQQADYFEERLLWSDALQTLYMVEQSSIETIQRREDLVNAVCNPDASAQINLS